MLLRPEIGQLAESPPQGLKQPRRRKAPGPAAGRLALAVCAAAIFANAKLATADGIKGVAENRSAASGYTFGFAAAASTVCKEVRFEELTVAHPVDPQGRVSADVAQGFADFSRELETAGADRACLTVAPRIRVRQ